MTNQKLQKERRHINKYVYRYHAYDHDLIGILHLPTSALTDTLNIPVLVSINSSMNIYEVVRHKCNHPADV